jgi:hypothetical protein
MTRKTLLPASLMSFCDRSDEFTPVYEAEANCSYATYANIDVPTMASVNAGISFLLWLFAIHGLSVVLTEINYMPVLHLHVMHDTGSFNLHVGGLANNKSVYAFYNT